MMGNSMPNRVHNGVCSIMFLPGHVAERATMTWLSDRHGEMFVVKEYTLLRKRRFCSHAYRVAVRCSRHNIRTALMSDALAAAPHILPMLETTCFTSDEPSLPPHTSALPSRDAHPPYSRATNPFCSSSSSIEVSVTAVGGRVRAPG